MQSFKKTINLFAAIALALTIVAAVFIGDAMAGGKGKGEDIILYNGNIVMREGGKGKGKGGSIVIANSHGHGHGEHESMYMDPFSMWGGHGRK